MNAFSQVEMFQRKTTSTTVVAHELEIECRVTAKQTVSEGVVTLSLEPVEPNSVPAWSPGAHVDLILEDAPTRQYSLCGDPADHHAYRLGILRDEEGRGSSKFVHDVLQTGDVVRIRGPRNNFPLVDAPRYIFIAGGIGITPILPMVSAAERAGADWKLIYGGRSRDSMAFLDELARYGDKIAVRPQDEYGLLDLDAILDVPSERTLVYCCGPEPLLAAVEERCAAWPAGTLRLERFTPKELTEPVLTDSFEVVLSQSGLTLSVPPERSILDVVEEAGIPVLSSCGEGTCGTCETAVIEGEPDHRDSVLNDQERAANDCMMICISRSCSKRLVLDL